MLLFFGDYGSMVRKWWIVAIWLIACNPFSDSLTNNTIEAAAALRVNIQIALFSNIQRQDIWGCSSTQSKYSNCTVLKNPNSSTRYLRVQQQTEYIFELQCSQIFKLKHNIFEGAASIREFGLHCCQIFKVWISISNTIQYSQSQGGRSCAKARRAFAEKVVLWRKF